MLSLSGVGVGNDQQLIPSGFFSLLSMSRDFLILSRVFAFDCECMCVCTRGAYIFIVSALYLNRNDGDDDVLMIYCHIVAFERVK